MAYETALTIYEVIQKISTNNYVLPAIQREFVWKETQIERLFDSLMRGYPIGTFLFWELPPDKYDEYQFYSFLQNYHQRDAFNTQKISLRARNDQVIAILDGQQRLTSIYIGLKGTYATKKPRSQWKNDKAFPKKRLYLNIIEPATQGDTENQPVSQEVDNENQYVFRFLTEESIKEYEGNPHFYWFEVGEILKMRNFPDVNKYLRTNIEQNYLYNEAQYDFASVCLNQLWHIIHSAGIISYYREQSNELDKVLNIFVRVNSGGTPLSYSDLLLSIATAKWETLDAREVISEFVNELNSIGSGFNVSKDLVLKASLVLADFKNIAFKVDNFSKTNMLRIESDWQTIKKSLYASLELVSSFGFNRKTLTSDYALIPIAYYLKMLGTPTNFETSTADTQKREKIKKWLILSLIKGVFSNHPDVILRQVRKLINDAFKENEQSDFPLKAIIDHFRGTNRSLVFTKDDVDMLLELEFNNPATHSALLLLYPQMDPNYKYHVDHIYPKSKFTEKVLRSKGVELELIPTYLGIFNKIANLQILKAFPNIEKSDKDFDSWFNATFKTDSQKNDYRESNYLPRMEYSFANFLQFIEERRKLLKIKFEELLMIDPEDLNDD